MKHIFTALIFSALAAVTIGCKNNIDTKKVAQLDSILEVVEADLEVGQKIEMQQLEKIISVYDQYHKFYSTEYESIDSLKYILHHLDQMENCRKSAKKTQAGLLGWQEELGKTIIQLRTLKHDYEEGIISTEEFEMHLGNEAQATFALNYEFQKRVGPCLACMRTFGELSNTLDSIRMANISNND